MPYLTSMSTPQRVQYGSIHPGGLAYAATDDALPDAAHDTSVDARGNLVDLNEMVLVSVDDHVVEPPSWESPAGLFSHENPNLRCADGTYGTASLGEHQGT